MALMTSNSIKKTFYYNFYPSKYEEEISKANSLPMVPRQRVLIEIRDVNPPPALDVQNPWQITKTLNHYEILSGKVVVSFNDSFDYILRYWNFCMAKHIAMARNKVAVILWDLTEETNPKKYEGNEVYFQLTPSENCILACMEMMRDRGLKVDDYIGLYWEGKDSTFRIKFFGSGATATK